MIINEFDKLLNEWFANEYSQNWVTTKKATQKWFLTMIIIKMKRIKLH